MARRLKKEEKTAILNGYCSGKSALELSDQYGCSPNTVIRTVKGMLPPEQYSNLKTLRSKERVPLLDLSMPGLLMENDQNITRDKSQKDYANDLPMEDSSLSTTNSDVSDHVKVDEMVLEVNSDNYFSVVDDPEFISDLSEDCSDDPNSFNPESKESTEVFQELAPLTESFGFDSEKQKISCELISEATLPDVVYILVDKKVELESKLLSEFAEWSFLPDAEKERLAVTLFPNQRTAKRNCSRNQRVLKVPNTNIFLLSAPYLVSRGITRLVLEDELIALDS